MEIEKWKEDDNKVCAPAICSRVRVPHVSHHMCALETPSPCHGCALQLNFLSWEFQPSAADKEYNKQLKVACSIGGQ